LKRAYEPPSTDDGERYLVERLWPRGVSKKGLALTAWLRDIAPSTELRKWYGHVEERWPEFAARYKQELAAPDKQKILSDLAQKARAGNVTLVFATRVAELSGAKVLKDLLEKIERQTGQRHGA
jgi:uncharacterized protein YeaO (DUF488 family)